MNRFYCLILLFLGTTFNLSFAQQTIDDDTFWKKVRFGGGFAANLGNNFTNLGVSPTAIYPVNEKFALGTSAQFSYMKQRQFFENTVYGVGVLGLYNPVPDIQLSAELDQLRVNQRLMSSSVENNFWNTALFLGGGYQTNQVIIGVRYNVLFREGDNLYGAAWMPFVRVFF